MCVSKIVTETREEKEEKVLRGRWGRREGKPGKSKAKGGSEYALAPLFTPAE
jgi:hypothetical protein